MILNASTWAQWNRLLLATAIMEDLNTYLSAPQTTSSCLHWHCMRNEDRLPVEAKWSYKHDRVLAASCSTATMRPCATSFSKCSNASPWKPACQVPELLVPNVLFCLNLEYYKKNSQLSTHTTSHNKQRVFSCVDIWINLFAAKMLIREYISVMSTPALLSYSGQCKSKQSTLLSLGRDAQQNGLAVMVGKLNETYCMWKDKKRHHYSDTSISWYDVLVTAVKETTGNVGLGHLAISWKTIIIPQQCHVLISSEQHSGWEVQQRGCRRSRLRVNSWKSCTKLLCRLFSIAYVSMFRHFVCAHRPHLILMSCKRIHGFTYLWSD